MLLRFIIIFFLVIANVLIHAQKQQEGVSLSDQIKGEKWISLLALTLLVPNIYLKTHSFHTQPEN